MIRTILGTKGEMSYRFTAEGRRVPVTILHTAPHTVLWVKTPDRDGYHAIQIGFGRRKHTGKCMLGQVKKASMTHAPQHIKEAQFFGSEKEEVKPGDTIHPTDLLIPGTVVKVTGRSKGRGFAGVVKRWGFSGGPATHGQSDRHRAPGSIGAGTTPGRVLRGKKMAGRMGNATATVRNLQVLEADKEKNSIVMTGAIPGPRGGLVEVTILDRPKEAKEMVWEEKKQEEKAEAKMQKSNMQGRKEK